MKRKVNAKRGGSSGNGNGISASHGVDHTDAVTRTRFIPVMEWPKYHPWPSVKSLRWLIYKGDENGFNRVVRRVGRRVLIDESAFFDWMASRNTIEPS